MKVNPSGRVPRLLIATAKAQGQTIALDEEQMHYCSRVLRIRDGESIRVWNGDGDQWLASIHYQAKHIGELHLLTPHSDSASTELNRPIHILQGLPEGDKMDWVLEKCTELGATGFSPVQAQRSVVKLDADRAAKRHSHWQRVMQAAATQCERMKLPDLAGVQHLGAALAKAQTLGPVLWFTPQAPISLIGWTKNAQSKGTKPIQIGQTLTICIGPEGGWSPEETQQAMGLGAVALKFSNRVLRTETFGVACLSQLTALLDLESTH